MKLIAVNKSSDTIPYLVCTCKDFSIDEKTSVLKISLGNEPYRTDGSGQSDVIVIHPDNYDWVDEWDFDDEAVECLNIFKPRKKPL